MAIPDRIKIMVNKANSIALIVPVIPRFIVCPKGTMDREFTRLEAMQDLMAARSAINTFLYGQ